MNRINAEDGSAAMLVVFVAGLFICLFVFILAGSMFDDMVSAYDLTDNSSLGSTFPVSDERVTAMNFTQQLWVAIPFLGILLPLIIYAVAVSIRKGPSDV